MDTLNEDRANEDQFCYDDQFSFNNFKNEEITLQEAQNDCGKFVNIFFRNIRIIIMLLRYNLRKYYASWLSRLHLFEFF